MFGRFGIVFILMIVLLCTGLFTGSTSFGFNADAAVIPGVALMIAALFLSAAAQKITAGLSAEKQQTMAVLIRLGSVALCGIGAIVVFCG